VNACGSILQGSICDCIVVAILCCLGRCCACLVNWLGMEDLQGYRPLAEDVDLVHWDTHRSVWAGVMVCDWVLGSTAGWACYAQTLRIVNTSTGVLTGSYRVYL